MKGTLKAFPTHSLTSLEGPKSCSGQAGGPAGSRGAENQSQPQTPFSPGPPQVQETQSSRQRNKCADARYIVSPEAFFPLSYTIYLNQLCISSASQEPFSERRWLMDLHSQSPSPDSWKQYNWQGTGHTEKHVLIFWLCLQLYNQIRRYPWM